MKNLETYLKNPRIAHLQISRELAIRKLKHFIPLLWNSVETKTYVGGWHIDMLAEHLEAVNKGQIKKLIINEPPRHTKSLEVSVFWPAWTWLNHPEIQWLFSSYAHSLAIRDSVKCRRIIESPLYQDMIETNQPGFVLMGDQNTKIRYDNNKGGYRLATSVDGALTGEGGDRIVIDDPHNVMEGESETKRNSCIDWWDDVMSTRLNDAKTGAYIIIMQRIHEEDLTGHILASNHKDWEHLCLPARYEGKNRIRTSLGCKDPRTKVGEPLFPQRFGDKELTSLENTLTNYAVAGQLQQRPAPREGAMFPVENFSLVNEVPINRIVKSVRYWDKAGTEGGGCFSAGVLIHLLRDNSYLIADVIKGQWSYGKREQRIKQTAELDGTDIEVWTEQEPGSGGKESAENTIKNLRGFTIHADKVTGAKELRAEPYAAQVEGCNVKVLKRAWTKDFIDEHQNFPNSKFKDQVDAASGAFNKLNAEGSKVGVWGRK